MTHFHLTWQFASGVVKVWNGAVPLNKSVCE
jgi:hypothetical protein